MTRLNKTLILSLLLLCLPRLVSAQVVVTQTSTLTFTPSLDHAIVVAGAPLLTNYTLKINAQGSATVVYTRDLGKPTPDAANVILQPIGWTAAQLSALPSGVYLAVVAAVGPGGATDSAPSNPFVVLTSPRAPGAPVVAR